MVLYLIYGFCGQLLNWLGCHRTEMLYISHKKLNIESSALIRLERMRLRICSKHKRLLKEITVKPVLVATTIKQATCIKQA